MRSKPSAAADPALHRAGRVCCAAWLALALLAAACAPAVEVPRIEGAESVRVFVTRQAPLWHALPGPDDARKRAAAFDAPDAVAAFMAFANDRRDGFAHAFETPPAGTVRVVFYRGGTAFDAFEIGGSGASYFIARGEGEHRAMRPLALTDLAAFAALTGHQADDLFRP